MIRTLLAFAAAAIVARALGALQYGDLNFLLGSFAAINVILDLGSSPAFYTLISRRRRGRRFFITYALWTFGIQLCGTFALLAFVLPSAVLQRIWLGNDRNLVLLSFGVSFVLTQTWTMVSQMGEAVRKTVVVQIAAVAQAVVHLALIFICLRLGVLKISTILWLLIIEYVVLALAIGPWLLRANLSVDDRQDEWRSVMGEFVAYGKPLFVYGLITFIYQFADRWLLQRFGGSRQQGFFSIGQQFAAVSLVATISILNVFWKEVAEAHHRGEEQRAAQLYRQVRWNLYGFAAWIGCMFVPYAGEILAMTVGADYSGARVALALMFLYPAHQTLGQLQGTYLLARGRTQAHARIGIAIMLLSVPVTWWILGPMAMGANGMAIKLVTLQWIAVTLQVAVIAHGTGVMRDVGYQFGLLGVLVAISFACRWIVQLVFATTRPTIFFVGAGVFLYVLITLPLLIRLSDAAGAGFLRNPGWKFRQEY